MERIYRTAIKAAIEGAKEILRIYHLDEIQVERKADNSPLTLADRAANSKIIQFLKKTDYPIISEGNKQLDYSIRKTGLPVRSYIHWTEQRSLSEKMVSFCKYCALSKRNSHFWCYLCTGNQGTVLYRG
jgi:3'-phosphoadenosine 5'-phosphosulfate (PAPS) 3'-phosphatase